MNLFGADTDTHRDAAFMLHHAAMCTQSTTRSLESITGSDKVPEKRSKTWETTNTQYTMTPAQCPTPTQRNNKTIDRRRVVIDGHCVSNLAMGQNVVQRAGMIFVGGKQYVVRDNQWVPIASNKRKL